MKNIKGARPSPALLVSIVALIVALAGTAVGGVVITSLNKKEKKQVTKIAKKVAKQKANRQIARKAPGLSVANADTLGGKPEGGLSVANAATLEGNRASAFASATSEPFRDVGNPGQPAFENSWSNWTGQPGYGKAGFFKDSWDIVHLKGVVDNGSANNDAVFTLPPAYRPDVNLLVVVHRFSGPASLVIGSSGAVDPLLGSGNLSLDGVTFRAG